MSPIAGVGLPLIIDKVSWITLFLTDPAPPQILNTFLVARRADDPQGVEIHRSFNDIGGISLHPLTKDRVSFEQNVSEQVILVLLGLDTVDGK
jgi:hypothetical protein